MRMNESKNREEREEGYMFLGFTHHMVDGLFCTHQKPPFIYGSDCDL